MTESTSGFILDRITVQPGRLEEYREYLDRLRDEAIIEWKSEDLRAAYEEYLTSVPVATPPR